MDKRKLILESRDAICELSDLVHESTMRSGAKEGKCHEKITYLFGSQLSAAKGKLVSAAEVLESPEVGKEYKFWQPMKIMTARYFTAASTGLLERVEEEPLAEFHAIALEVLEDRDSIGEAIMHYGSILTKAGGFEYQMSTEERERVAPLLKIFDVADAYDKVKHSLTLRKF
jgi:hypothetical protein